MSLETILPSLVSSSSAITGFLGNYAVHSTALLGVAWACTGRRSPLPVGTKESVWRGALVLSMATAAAATAFPALGVVPRALADRLPSLSSILVKHESMAPASAATPMPLLSRLAKATPGTISTVSPVLLPARVDYSRFMTKSQTEPVVGPVPPPSSTTTSSIVSPSVMQNSMTATTPALPIGVWVSAGWLALAAAGLARLLALRIKLSQTLGPREPVGSTRLACLFDSLADEMGLTGQVRLTQSRRLSTPVALPTGEVCIPTGILEALPWEQQRCILAHELAHVARRDPAWLMGMRALEAAFWFQPLNRVARRKLQELAEYACDDAAATSTSGGDLAMANSLATAARWLGGEAPALAAAMAAGPSTLVRRVERLLGDAEPKNLTGLGRIVLAAPVLAAIGVVTLSPSALADEGKRVPPVPPAAPTEAVTPEPSTPPGVPAPVAKRVIIGAGANGEAPVAYVLNGGAAEPVTLAPLADLEGLYTATINGNAPLAVAGFGGNWDGQAFTVGGKRNVIGVGISSVQGALAAQLGIEPGTATVVDQVYDESEAAKAGLKQYDIITSIDGGDASPNALREAIAAKKPGESITLTVRRGTETITVPVGIREVEGGLFAATPMPSTGYAFAPSAGVHFFNGEDTLSEDILEELRKSMGPNFNQEIDEAVKRAIEAARESEGAHVYAFGAAPEARAEAMRRAELAMERARDAYDGQGAAAISDAMARLAEDQARLHAQLERLHASGIEREALLNPSTLGAPSKLRDGYLDLLTRDIVKKLSGKGYSGDLAALESAIRESAAAALVVSDEVSESVTCTNNKCKGTISVDSKSFSELLANELIERDPDVTATVKGGEEVLRSAIKSVCGDNESFKLTWEN